MRRLPNCAKPLDRVVTRGYRSFANPLMLPSQAILSCPFKAADRGRSGNLRLGKPTLCQLSYRRESFINAEHVSGPTTNQNEGFVKHRPRLSIDEPPEICRLTCACDSGQSAESDVPAVLEF